MIESTGAKGASAEGGLPGEERAKEADARAGLGSLLSGEGRGDGGDAEEGLPGSPRRIRGTQILFVSFGEPPVLLPNSPFYALPFPLGRRRWKVEPCQNSKPPAFGRPHNNELLN
jgi:hypothetical protein